MIIETKDLILKKYEQYIINEKSKDGVILITPDKLAENGDMLG